MKNTNRKRSNRWIAMGVLCLSLLACQRPLASPTSTTPPPAMPAQTLTPAPSHTPTSDPNPTDGPGQSSQLFHGCWLLETEEVSFEMQLEQQGIEVKGTFLLVKICVVGGEPSACRIREGVVEGVVTTDALTITLSIPEYDDEGAALLTLADDGGTLSWEELEYPEIGLADGDEHYLPSSLTLIRCDA